MIYDHVCQNCQSTNLRRSRLVSVLEHLLASVLPVYRCMSCSLRQYKLWTVKVGDNRPEEKVTWVVDRF